MSFNLMDLVKDQVMGQLAGKAAGFLGESESGVTKALGGIFPMLLGSVVDKASDNEGASGIMNMLKGADGNIVNNIAGMFGDGEGSPEGLVEQGGSMLSGLLGDKVGGLTSLVSKFSGVSEGSTSSLMGMAAPMIMGMLGKQVKSEGLGISGLQGLLEGQKDSIASAMPEGLADLAGGAGLLGSLGGIVSGITGAGKDAFGAVGDAGKNVVGGAVDFAGKGVDAGKKVVGGAADAVSGAAGAVGDAGKKVVGGAADLAGKGIDAGKKVVGGAADAVSGAAGAVGDAGKKVVGGAADLAGKGVDVASDLGKGAVKTGGSILRWLLPLFLVLLLLGFLITRYGCSTGIDSLDNAAKSTMGATEGVVGGAADLAGDAVGAVGDAASATAGAVGDAAGAVGDAVGDVAGAAGDLVSGAFSKVNEAAKATLDGISFAAGSAGEQFMGFVNGGFKGDARFRFNNLTFATGSATIDGASMSEVDNIAAIMKAYPEVKINVEGYTDNTGNADANIALSNSRAIAVKNRLVEQGVAANRIAAEGYGAANPVADNGTAEGRKQNRRIEVTIAK